MHELSGRILSSHPKGKRLIRRADFAFADSHTLFCFSIIVGYAVISFAMIAAMV
jgi:hypothetical protein